MNDETATPPEPFGPTRARLRILSTTDLHGHVLAHDYIKDRPTQGIGLATLAPLIHAARAEAEAMGAVSLLLDNGDTFQGTPMARYLVHQPEAADHPIADALNALRYDAVGVGNHDLDHGLDYLTRIARRLTMPMLCTNLVGAQLAPLKVDTLIRRVLPGAGNAGLSIGLVSILPTQTAAWHAHHLGANRALVDHGTLLRSRARALRDAGADLVIALAHMGVEDGLGSKTGEAAALGIARSGAVDAMLLGHVHRRLPGPDYTGWRDVDATRGSVLGIPAIMSGHSGSDLGVMDLDLGRGSDGTWEIRSHRCMLRSNPKDRAADPQIRALTMPSHHKLRARLAAPVANLHRSIHSFFSLAAPAPTQWALARSKMRMIAEALPAENDLPILAAVAALASGGRDGPDNFIAIPKGPVLHRHVVGLNPYANQTLGVEMTGQDLRRWLEQSARVFTTLDPGAPAPQPLVDPDMPGFQFDTIFGITYTINPRRPPMQRIAALCYNGVPVTDDQRFILATNQFRVAGGGGYTPVPPEKVVTEARTKLEDAIIETLRGGLKDDWLTTPPWQFATGARREAILQTDPAARNHLDDIQHLTPKPMGLDDDGFLRLRLSL